MEPEKMRTLRKAITRFLKATDVMENPGFSKGFEAAEAAWKKNRAEYESARAALEQITEDLL